MKTPARAFCISPRESSPVMGQPAAQEETQDLQKMLIRKAAYEKFSIEMMRSEYMMELARNNRAYRHVLRFAVHCLGFTAFLVAIKQCFALSVWLGLAAFPAYVYAQGFLIAGFMIHSHELSHNQIKSRKLNDALGVLSALVSYINFYSFQRAHRLHHRFIGNVDAPEAGAPVSLSGQKRILDEDKLYRLMGRLYDKSKILWYLSSWPLFIGYGDYNSWLLPFRSGGKFEKKSLAVFVLFATVNVALAGLFPLQFTFLYLLPVLTGGNAILAITFMHHAHEDSVFFSEKHHNVFNTIMATTDRDFGPFINLFMMNNGYHIPHHLNPRIAWYDLKRANAYLRSRMPEGLTYNFYPQSRFFRDLFNGFYEKRLDRDYEFYQLKFISGEASRPSSSVGGHA